MLLGAERQILTSALAIIGSNLSLAPLIDIMISV